MRRLHIRIARVPGCLRAPLVGEYKNEIGSARTSSGLASAVEAALAAADAINVRRVSFMLTTTPRRWNLLPSDRVTGLASATEHLPSANVARPFDRSHHYKRDLRRFRFRVRHVDNELLYH